MAELTDRGLDTLLASAAAELRVPPSPNLRASVVEAITRPAPRRAGSRVGSPAWPAARGWRLVAAAAALAVAFALGALLANPDARTAVGEFFGIVEGQRIEIVPAATRTATTGTATATPTPTPLRLSEIARPINLDEVGAILDFPAGVPEGLGEPDGVYLVEWGGQPMLVLQYPELALWQTHGRGFFEKGLGPDDIIEQPSVNGHAAWWIDAEGHATAFFDADGNEVRGSRRSVESHVLAWNGADGRYYRMETELPLEEAVAIAESLP